MSRGLASLLAHQREYQAVLEEKAQRRLLALQKAALADLEERLKAARGRHEDNAFTVQLLLSLRGQVQALVSELVKRLDGQLKDLCDLAQTAGVRDLLDQAWLMEGGISIAVQSRLALQIQEHARLRRPETLKRYGEALVSRLEQELAVNVLGQVSRWQVVDRLLTASKEHFELTSWRAGLIYRNELANAYDDAARLTNEGLAQELSLVSAEPLLTRMDEARDRRSHPFSLVAHGTTALAGQPWRVSVAEVAAMAARRKSRAGGIVWPVVDGFYTGMGYIAHHNDRGRRTCWRKSWGDPKQPES